MADSKNTIDFLVGYYNAVVIITPLSPRAIEWTKTNIPNNARWYGQCSYLVKREHVDAVVKEIRASNFNVYEEGGHNART